jgi:putative endonuclease
VFIRRKQATVNSQHSIYAKSAINPKHGVRLPIYVYVLQSLKDKKFYTGCTADPKKRLKQHNAGRVRSTKARRPLKLVYWETFATRSEAMKRERRLKRIGSAGKKALIQGFYGRLR